MAEDGETTGCCGFAMCCRKPEQGEEVEERQPLLRKEPETIPPEETNREAQIKTREQTDDIEKPGEQTDDKEKISAKPKELQFEKFHIVELDNIFDNFTLTLTPFVTNRLAMETAETTFMETVASLIRINPKARFIEHLQALKAELREANIALKIKDGVMVVVSEAGEVVEEVRRAVTAINRILDAGKNLKPMPLRVEKATEDALAETEELDVMAILKREFKNWYDSNKILRHQKNFAKNVQMIKQAPGMVKLFCETAREIVLYTYRVFADKDEEVPSYSDEDDKDDKEDDKKNDSEESAVGGKSEETRSEGSDQTGKEEEEKEKEDFYKSLEFKVVGVQEIDRVFANLAQAMNPFVVKRDKIQKAKEDFENNVRQICNFEREREFKVYVKELKDKAETEDITIYVDSSDGKVKVTSVKGTKPPKPYRDAVKALNKLKKAGKKAIKLEPDVQNGIAACIEDMSHIDPKRDLKRGLEFRDIPKLARKVQDLNETRKKVHEVPEVVKEFCRYVEGLITDLLEVLVEGKEKTEKEKTEEGDGRSDEEKGGSKDKDKDERRGKRDKGEDKEKEQENKDEGENDKEKEEGEVKNKNERQGKEEEHEDEEQKQPDKDEGEGEDEQEQEEGKKKDKEEDKHEEGKNDEAKEKNRDSNATA